MASFAPVKTRRVFEEITDQIREQFRAGDLAPGDKLPSERDLAQSFGASRNAVREALRSLEQSGTIELRKGAHGGAFVTGGNPDSVGQSMVDLLCLGGVTVAEVTEARLLIETEVVRLACRNATADDLAILEQNVSNAERLNAARLQDEKRDANIAFHVLLAKATHNPVLTLTMQLLMDLLREVHRTVGWSDTDTVLTSRRRLLECIASRDEDAAVAEIRDLLDRLHRIFDRAPTAP